LTKEKTTTVMLTDEDYKKIDFLKSKYDLTSMKDVIKLALDKSVKSSSDETERGSTNSIFETLRENDMYILYEHENMIYYVVNSGGILSMRQSPIRF